VRFVVCCVPVLVVGLVSFTLIIQLFHSILHKQVEELFSQDSFEL
jgi:hypothetical protein